MIDPAGIEAEAWLRSARRSNPIVLFELIVAAGRAVPSGIVGAIVPGWFVGADGDWMNWIGWTGRHAPRFRIVEREMYGLGLLNLGRVDYAAVRAQRGRWSAATRCIQTISESSVWIDSQMKGV